MNGKILAVVLAAVLGLGLSAFSYHVTAQVEQENRVVSTMLRLTHLIQGQVSSVQAVEDNILEDLLFKKKFYQFAPSFVVDEFVFVIAILDCPLPEEGACAFNVESIQLKGSSAGVRGIIVDEVAVDITGKEIDSPTNLLVDSGMGIVGSSDFVAIVLDDFFTGEIEWSGEKPQGMRLFTIEPFASGIASTSEVLCSPGADFDALIDCIEGKVDSMRGS
jgi:hypothetical protein